MREKYESLSLTVLKDLAKARGIKGLTGLKKEQVVELMLAEDAKEKEPAQAEKKNVVYTTNKENNQPNAVREDNSELDSGQVADGILEVMTDGFGFIRCENFLPGENDIYVSPAQIRRFGLKTGDIVHGGIRVKNQGEKTMKYAAVLGYGTVGSGVVKVGQCAL